MNTYLNLVMNKINGKKYLMIGNLKNCNIDSGRYLYPFVDERYPYAKKTPYGLRSNVSSDIKYNSREYKVVHQTAL